MLEEARRGGNPLASGRRGGALQQGERRRSEWGAGLRVGEARGGEMSCEGAVRCAVPEG